MSDCLATSGLRSSVAGHDLSRRVEKSGEYFALKLRLPLTRVALLPGRSAPTPPRSRRAKPAVFILPELATLLIVWIGGYPHDGILLPSSKNDPMRVSRSPVSTLNLSAPEESMRMVG